jgi:hypothetical protein
VELLLRRLPQNENSLAAELTSYPRELDDHVRLYGMRADEFQYSNEICPTCDNRIDSLGWCGHGNIGGD